MKKCSIRLKSFNYIIIENIANKFLDEANKLNLDKASIIRLPKNIKKFSLIKSPHVHKKSREQFETITYSRLLHIEGSKEMLEKLINKIIIKNKYSFYYKVEWHL
jgi:small subunit ribosomal protein S10